ncbi:MAG TPA: DUF5683 domain-containing protein [Bacteroidia bacterium]|nr:DUF5683 domain-containing protein [Bacteroidia bacterium]
MKSQDKTPAGNDSIVRNQIDKKVYTQARRATWMSVFLPGLGQAYNKKYWKIPIVYAGLGTFAYFFSVNNQEYNYYRNNLLAITDSDPNTQNSTPYSQDQLKTLKDQYKKNRDLSTIGFVAVYILNIIDANIDGHLASFDVSDNLGIRLEPWYENPTGFSTPVLGSAGLSIKLNFK